MVALEAVNIENFETEVFNNIRRSESRYFLNIFIDLDLYSNYKYSKKY